MKSGKISTKVDVIFLAALILVFLPGCKKYHQLVPSESYQGIKKEKPQEISKKFVRSVKVYDEFETIANFDFLLFCGEALEKYSQIYSSRRGLDENEMVDQLQEKIEKDRDQLLFYVLADVRSKKNASLSDKDSCWKIYLNGSNGEKIAPESILEVELEPEIQALFGDRGKQEEFRFKIPYLVKFPAGSVTEKIKNEDSCKISIESVFRRCNLSWHENKDYLSKNSISSKNKKKSKNTGKFIAQKTNNGQRKTGAVNEDFHWV